MVLQFTIEPENAKIVYRFFDINISRNLRFSTLREIRRTPNEGSEEKLSSSYSNTREKLLSILDLKLFKVMVQMGSLVSYHYWQETGAPAIAGACTRCHLRSIGRNAGFEVVPMNAKNNSKCIPLKSPKILLRHR